MSALSDVAVDIERFQRKRIAEWTSNPERYRIETDGIDVVQSHWLELRARQRLVMAGRYRREFCPTDDDATLSNSAVEDDWQYDLLRAELVRVATSSAQQKESDEMRDRWNQMSAPLPGASVTCGAPDGETIRFAERKVMSHLDALQESLLDAYRNTTADEGVEVESAQERALMLMASAYQARRQADDLRLYASIRPDVLKGTVFNTTLTSPAAAVSDLIAAKPSPSPPPPPTPSATLKKSYALGGILSGGGGIALGGDEDPAPRTWFNDNVFLEGGRYVPGRARPMRDANLSLHCRMLRLERGKEALDYHDPLQALFNSYRARHGPRDSEPYVSTWPPQPADPNSRRTYAQFVTDYGHPVGGWPAKQLESTDPKSTHPEADTSRFGWHMSYDPQNHAYKANKPDAATPVQENDGTVTYTWSSKADPTIVYYPFTYWKRAAILGSRASLWRYAYLMYMLIHTGTDERLRAYESSSVLYNVKHTRKAPRRPLDLEHAIPRKEGTNAVDLARLQNELDTILRLATGLPVFMDTHDADEEALFMALGHPGKIRAALFDELFFNDDTAYFTMDTNAWRSDALYTGGVKPRLRGVAPKAPFGSAGIRRWYQFMGGMRAKFFSDDTAVGQAKNRLAMIGAHALVASQLSTIPLTVFSFALPPPPGLDAHPLAKVAFMYLTPRFIHASVWFATHVALMMKFKPEPGASKWKGIQALGIYAFAAAIPTVPTLWAWMTGKVAFQFAPDGIDHADVWAQLRATTKIPADAYRKLHPLVYRSREQIEEIRDRVRRAMETEEEKRAEDVYQKRQKGRDAARAEAATNNETATVYSFAETGALPLAPLRVEPSLVEVFQHFGNDSKIWSETPGGRPRDANYEHPVMRANLLNFVAALRLVEGEVRSNRFQTGLAENGKAFLSAPQLWPRAAAYLGNPSLSSDESARRAFVAGLKDDYDYVANQFEFKWRPFGSRETDVQEMETVARRLLYMSGEESLDRIMALAKNLNVSTSSRLGVDAVLSMVAEHPEMRDNVGALIDDPGLLALRTTTPQDLQALPSPKLTRPSDCLYFGGMITAEEYTGYETTPLTTIPTMARNNETATTHLTPKDLERFCLFPLVVANSYQQQPDTKPFESLFPRAPIVSATSAAAAGAAEPDRPWLSDVEPVNQTALNERVYEAVSDPTQVQLEQERIINASNRRTQWRQLVENGVWWGVWERWTGFWTVQTTFSHFKSFREILTNADHYDPGVAFQDMKTWTYPNGTYLDPTNKDDLTYYLNQRLVTNLVATFSHPGGHGYRAFASMQEFCFTVPVVELYEVAHKHGDYWGTLASMPMKALANKLNQETGETYHMFTVLDNYVGLAGLAVTHAAWFTVPLQTFLLGAAPFSMNFAPVAAATALGSLPAWMIRLGLVLLAEAGLAGVRYAVPDAMPTREDIFRNELIILAATSAASRDNARLSRVRKIYAFRARMAFTQLVGLLFSRALMNNMLAYTGWSWIFSNVWDLLPYKPEFLVTPSALTTLKIIGETVPDWSWIGKVVALAIGYLILAWGAGKVAKKLRLPEMLHAAQQVPGISLLSMILGTLISALFPSTLIVITPSVMELVKTSIISLLAGLAPAFSKPAEKFFANLPTEDDALALLPVELREVFYALVGQDGSYRRNDSGRPILDEEPRSTSKRSDPAAATAPTKMIALGRHHEGTEGSGDDDDDDDDADPMSLLPPVQQTKEWSSLSSSIGNTRRGVTVLEMSNDMVSRGEPTLQRPHALELLDLTMAAYHGGNGNGEWGDGTEGSASTSLTFIGLAL